jgi:hypothetical protein
MLNKSIELRKKEARPKQNPIKKAFLAISNFLCKLNSKMNPIARKMKAKVSW